MTRWCRQLQSSFSSFFQAQAFSNQARLDQAFQAHALPSPSLKLGIELEKLELGAPLIIFVRTSRSMFLTHQLFLRKHTSVSVEVELFFKRGNKESIGIFMFRVVQSTRLLFQ
jgi:hypothetical protein